MATGRRILARCVVRPRIVIWTPSKRRSSRRRSPRRMPRAGKRIVLDASVARSAGSGPIPGRRRAVFGAIEERHSVVFSEECLAEWKKHEQAFARGWRARMVARRQVLFLQG